MHTGGTLLWHRSSPPFSSALQHAPRRRHRRRSAKWHAALAPGLLHIWSPAQPSLSRCARVCGGAAEEAPRPHPLTDILRNLSHPFFFPRLMVLQEVKSVLVLTLDPIFPNTDLRPVSRVLYWPCKKINPWKSINGQIINLPSDVFK